MCSPALDLRLSGRARSANARPRRDRPACSGIECFPGGAFLSAYQQVSNSSAARELTDECGLTSTGTFVLATAAIVRNNCPSDGLLHASRHLVGLSRPE